MGFRCQFVLLALLSTIVSCFIGSSIAHEHKSPKCWYHGPTNDRNITCLDGRGGMHCDKDVCLGDEAVACRNGRCRCTDHYNKGDGMVLCGEKNEEVCYMVSDPRLRTFSGESVGVPVSCKFLMSHMRTDLMHGGVQVGQCVIEAFAWGVKGRGAGRRGKHFTGGMEILFIVMHEREIMYHSTRIFGEARNGVYQFTEQGHKEPIRTGTYGYAITTEIPGVGIIHTVYDPVNNIAEVQADCCGVMMGFRPPEATAAKASTQMSPGVYIKVDNNFVPNYLSKTSGLCMAPGVSLQDFIKELEEVSGKEVDKETAIMYRILKSPTPQNFPGAPPGLQAIVEIADECDPKSLVCAIQNCLFITKYPKFMKCWGRNRDKKSSESESASQEESSQSSESLEDGLILRTGRSLENEMMKESKESSGQSDESSSSSSSSSSNSSEEKGKKGFTKVLKLMAMCFESFCDLSSEICLKIQEILKENKDCLPFIPMGKSILDFDCSKLDAD